MSKMRDSRIKRLKAWLVDTFCDKPFVPMTDEEMEEAVRRRLSMYKTMEDLHGPAGIYMIDEPGCPWCGGFVMKKGDWCDNCHNYP